MSAPDQYYPPHLLAAASQPANDIAERIQLVKRYNCLVGKPGKITSTIQKQFLTGFMSNDDVEALRSVYDCVIQAMESAILLCHAGAQEL
jgi:hypothetical protein